MLDGTIQKKYLCLYPDCNKRYVATDGLRKHCKKNHIEWLGRKKPTEYGYEIPAEYEGTDYVRDYMSMVRILLGNENMSPPREPPPSRVHPPPSRVQPPPQIPLNVDFNIPIDFYTRLFCEERLA